MARYRCPQCGSPAVAEEGAFPVCPGCGYGSEYAGVGAGAASGAIAPGVSSGGLGAGSIVVIVVSIFLVVGAAAAVALYYTTDIFGGDEDGGGTGGNGGGGGGSSADANALAEGAMDRLASALLDASGSDLRLMTMDIAPGPEATDGFEAAIEMEWGLDNVTRLLVSMTLSEGGTGISFEVEVFCSEDRAAIVFGDDVLGSRFNDPEECQTDLAGQSADVDPFTEDFGFLDLTDASALEFTKASRQSDGTITVTYFDADGNEFDAVLDASGRVLSMHVSDPEVEADLAFDYGPRRSITVPAATADLPADVTAVPVLGASDPSQQTYTLSTPHEGLDRREFDIHIYTWADDPETATPITTFNLNSPASQKGFVFAWASTDVSPSLDDGEQFRITREGADVLADYQVIIWDTVVDAPAGSTPIPGFGLLAVLVAGMVASMIRPKRP